ncbi:MAG: helix-hairpin-helix domain-containing protein [bacterium]|nr:helix-hairpin-helix domain-containing protein [bacterium]
MIKVIFSHLRNHFGFSKSESNGLLLLIPTLFLCSGLLYVYKIYLSNDINTELSLQELEEWRKEISLKKKEQAKNVVSAPIKREFQKFEFDPNKISKEQIISLGFTERVANNWTKFLNAKGRFYEKSDLLNIYGINKSRVKELESYIIIEKRKPQIFKTEVENSEVISKSDINSASLEELKSVRGIGKVLSNRIIKYRDKLGGFHSEDQLVEVYGLKEDVINNLLEQFEISKEVLKIQINSDSVKYLASHPYINYNLARAIVNYRHQHGNFNSEQDLSKIEILNDTTLFKIQPYITFE